MTNQKSKPGPRELNTVALLVDLPEHGLRKGQVGTIVADHGAGSFEVEFSDSNGRTYAMLPLRTEQFMVLLYAPSSAA